MGVTLIVNPAMALSMGKSTECLFMMHRMSQNHKNTGTKNKTNCDKGATGRQDFFLPAQL